MRIVTLMEDSRGREDCLFEHGLSFYVETKRHKLLLDTGASEKTLANAKVLGVDVSKVDLVFLSHGHYDHSGGILPFVQKNPGARIYMHEFADRAYFHVKGSKERYIGIDSNIAALPQVEKVSGSFVVDEEIEMFSHITGRRYFAEGNRELKRREGGWLHQDSFLHEQCAVIRQGQETVLFTGCAHNGIVNIMDRYYELYRGYPTVVLGGFHLMQKEGYTREDLERIRDTARELANLPSIFYTGHCTGAAAFEEMKKIMGPKLRALRCGMEVLNFEH